MIYPRNVYVLFIGILLFSACSENSDNNDNDVWLIDSNEVFDGGPGKDGIPSVDNPNYTKASDVNFLNESDLVDVYINEDAITAYPHPVMDWHEIVNDEVGGQAVAVTYCPLTGTGIAWDRTINGKETTFGVSGLLFNSNLMPYDRESDSYWSQIRQDCVNGELINEVAEQLPLLEMSFGAFQSAYPNANVVNTNTGASRDYTRYPYGDYKTNQDRLLFPVDDIDGQLSNKERVLAILGNSSNVSIVTFDLLQSNSGMKEIQINEKNILIIGERQRNYINAFVINEEDTGKFSYNSEAFPFVLSRNDGRVFDVFGREQNGDQVLEVTDNYIGYYFTFPAFFDQVNIIE